MMKEMGRHKLERIPYSKRRMQGYILTYSRFSKTERRRGGKTTSGNGQTWSSPSPRGQRRTEENKWRKLVVKSSVVPKRPWQLRDR